MSARKEGVLSSYDGTSLQYCSEGEGLPLITCNGILCSLGYWVYFRPYFRRTCRVICWDYRGHGKSGLPADPSHVGIDSHCQDLKTIMDGLDIPKAVLVGHSMGVQVILEFYKNHPERVSGLLPICGTYGYPFRTFYGRPWMENIYPPIFTLGERHARDIERIFKPLLRTRLPVPIARLTRAIHWYLCPTEIMKDYFLQISRMDFECGFRSMMAMATHSAEEVLGGIKVPTLIIAGEKDLFTPVWVAEKMWRDIPGAELLVIPRGSHTALVENPSLMNLRVEVFLRDHFQQEGFVSKKGRSRTRTPARTSPKRTSRKRAHTQSP